MHLLVCCMLITAICDVITACVAGDCYHTLCLGSHVSEPKGHVCFPLFEVYYIVGIAVFYIWANPLSENVDSIQVKFSIVHWQITLTIIIQQRLLVSICSGIQRRFSGKSTGTWLWTLLGCWIWDNVFWMVFIYISVAVLPSPRRAPCS
jgi:hypothetical protein